MNAYQLAIVLSRMLGLAVMAYVLVQLSTWVVHTIHGVFDSGVPRYTAWQWIAVFVPMTAEFLVGWSFFFRASRVAVLASAGCDSAEPPPPTAP